MIIWPVFGRFNPVFFRSSVPIPWNTSSACQSSTEQRPLTVFTAFAAPGNKHEHLCINEEMFAAMHGWKRRQLVHGKKQIVKPMRGTDRILLTHSFEKPTNQKI